MNTEPLHDMAKEMAATGAAVVVINNQRAQERLTYYERVMKHLRQQNEYISNHYTNLPNTITVQRTKHGTGRNSQCECGSGKKSKNCCRNKEYK